jgi:hypothetical protein
MNWKALSWVAFGAGSGWTVLRTPGGAVVPGAVVGLPHMKAGAAAVAAGAADAVGAGAADAGGVAGAGDAGALAAGAADAGGFALGAG